MDSIGERIHIDEVHIPESENFDKIFEFDFEDDEPWFLP